MKKFLAILMILILSVFMFGCSGTDTGSGSGNQAQSSSQGQSTKDKSNNSNQSAQSTDTNKNKTEFTMPDAMTLPNQTIKVDKIERSSGTEFDKPKDGHEFVIVHLTIKNTGKDKISYNPFYFKLQNSKGQIVDETFTTVNSDNALDSGELTAGGTVSGTMAFEVPKGDTGLTLLFNDSLLSEKDYKLHLK